jgi:hypothetical protein
MRHTFFGFTSVLVGLAFFVTGCGGSESASSNGVDDSGDVGASSDSFTSSDSSPHDTRVSSDTTSIDDTAPRPFDVGSDTTPPPTDGGGSCVDRCQAAHPDGFSAAMLELYDCYCEAAPDGCDDVCGLSKLCMATSPVTGSDFCGRCVADHESATTGPCAADATRCKADASCAAFLACLDAQCPH